MLGFALLTVVAMATTTMAFPSGAYNNVSNPLDALSSHCTSGNFRPNHGDNLPQATPPPFKITVTSPAGHIYQPRKTVTITLEPHKTQTGTPVAYIKGFFMQGDSTESAFAGDLKCDPQQGKNVNFCSRNGVTHTDGIPKAKVVCRWTPPDFQIGKVQFVATIVENFTTFWTGVKSEMPLSGDPNTMTYKQKAQELSRQMMNQFQGVSKMTNFFRRNPSVNTNAQQGNPFEALMSQVQTTMSDPNPLSNLLGGVMNMATGSQASNLLGGRNQGSAWGMNSRARQQQPANRNNFNPFDTNAELAMANLPASFQSFFQP